MSRPAARRPLWRGAALALLTVLAACTAAEPPPPVVVAPPPPVAVVEPPPPAVVPPPSPVPKYAGHVASYKTMVEAEAAWPRLAARFPTLNGAPKRFVEVDLGGPRGKVVRLLVGGFPQRDEALAYCRTLRTAGLYCAPHDLPAAL